MIKKTIFIFFILINSVFGLDISLYDNIYAKDVLPLIINTHFHLINNAICNQDNYVLEEEYNIITDKQNKIFISKNLRLKLIGMIVEDNYVILIAQTPNNIIIKIKAGHLSNKYLIENITFQELKNIIEFENIKIPELK